MSQFQYYNSDIHVYTSRKKLLLYTSSTYFTGQSNAFIFKPRQNERCEAYCLFLDNNVQKCCTGNNLVILTRPLSCSFKTFNFFLKTKANTLNLPLLELQTDEHRESYIQQGMRIFTKIL